MKNGHASSLFETPVTAEEPGIMHQGNLTVYLISKVKKVIFKNDVNEAIGIDVQSRAGGSVTMFVKKTGMIFLNSGAY